MHANKQPTLFRCFVIGKCGINGRPTCYKLDKRDNLTSGFPTREENICRNKNDFRNIKAMVLWNRAIYYVIGEIYVSTHAFTTTGTHVS